MKNKIVFLVIVSGLLFGCTLSGQPKTPVNETKTGGVFSSIRDAITQSMSVKCEYPTVGDNKVVVYIKGNLIRIDGNWTSNDNTGLIMKEGKLWTWSNTKKEGLIMALNTDKENGTSEREVIDNLESKKEYCKTAVVADSIFEAPADVKFSDLTKLMEGVQN